MSDIDEDLALAMRLQEEFDRQYVNEINRSDATKKGDTDRLSSSSATTCGNTIETDNMSLVDPRWETLDPNPDARTLFLQFNDRFFSGKLAGVEVKWSPRMTLCAGLCSYEGHGGLCSVRLSQPLLKLRPRKDLIETLLHEMIHAYLFVTANNRDHDAHGPEFHKHMYRINKETGTNISVYHTFHDEVDHHHQHWWRCDGPCQKRKPYFGYVKRSMNRAPHPRDTWWADHQRVCGGSYTKVREPENYGKKKAKARQDGQPKSTSLVKPKGVPDIRSVFGKTKDQNRLTRTGDADSNSMSSPTRAAPLVENKDAKSTVSIFSGRGFTTGRQGKPGSVLGKVAKPTFSTLPSSPRSVLSSSPPAKVPQFPGHGVALRGGAEPNDVPQRVVRKLPGIGLITCERPITSDASPTKLRDPLSPAKPTHNTVPLSALASNGIGSNVGIKRKFVDESSDSDTDSILQQLRKAKRRKSEPAKKAKRNSIGVGGLSRSLTLDRSLSSTSPGTVRRVLGFRSVSAKNAKPPEFVHKDPKIIAQEREWLIKKGRSTPKGGLHLLLPTASTSHGWVSTASTSKDTDKSISFASISFSSSSDDNSESNSPESETNSPKKEKPCIRSPKWELAADRNRRAILGDSDDSDSDSEQRPLKSVHSKRNEPLYNIDSFANVNAQINGSSAGIPVAPSAASWGNTSVVPSTVNRMNTSFVAPPVEDPMQECPVCTEQVCASVINQHLDACLSGF